MEVIKYCSICHQPTQKKIVLFGNEKIVGCCCNCMKRELQKREEVFKYQEIERNRLRCFEDINMKNITFSSDNGGNPKLSKAMSTYVDKFSQFYLTGDGLLLHGSLGTGKSFYAACIANKLIDNGYSVLMTNFESINIRLQSLYAEKAEYLSSLNAYDLLILDDLGAERNTDYMLSLVYEIINNRYCTKKPLLITTNVSMSEMTNCTDIRYNRIYDRIFERCHPVQINGGSQRKRRMAMNYKDFNAAIGL